MLNSLFMGIFNIVREGADSEHKELTYNNIHLCWQHNTPNKNLQKPNATTLRFFAKNRPETQTRETLISPMMLRTSPPSFYEFRGHHSNNPTPWHWGFEADDFVDFQNNAYTLSGFCLWVIKNEDFVRIAMISQLVDANSRIPVLLMKQLFDRYDCARAIRFSGFVPSDVSSMRFDDVMSLRDYMIRNMGDKRTVQTHCGLLDGLGVDFQFDVEPHLRKIDGRMRCSPRPHAKKRYSRFYPAIRFVYHTPELVGLTISLQDSQVKCSWALPQDDILRRLQGLCGWPLRLEGIRVLRPKHLPQGMLKSLSELVETMVTKRKSQCREPEWETTNQQQIEILLELNPKTSADILREHIQIFNKLNE